MADHAGTPPDPVNPFLDAAWAPSLPDVDPVTRDFYLTLRRLEIIHRDRPRLGEGVRVSEEPVRLGQKPTLAFEASTILATDPRKDGLPPRLEVGFFGVFGPNGPLPLHLTEYAHQRMHHSHDGTLVQFLNIFHHRMLTLFYRAWANSQPTVSRDRPDSDRFARFVRLCARSHRAERKADDGAHHHVGAREQRLAQRHPGRVHAHAREAILARFLAQLDHFVARRLGLEQRVIDQLAEIRGHFANARRRADAHGTSAFHRAH